MVIPSADVLRALAILKVDRVLRIYPTLEDALRPTLEDALRPPDS